tara:strand:- start:2299 stop:2673 length:375 start_codon:yes stop_codon:yes gene_type:complete
MAKANEKYRRQAKRLKSHDELQEEADAAHAELRRLRLSPAQRLQKYFAQVQPLVAPIILVLYIAIDAWEITGPFVAFLQHDLIHTGLVTVFSGILAMWMISGKVMQALTSIALIFTIIFAVMAM